MVKLELDENSVLVICAHSDDQIFGPGGTMIKYANEKKHISTIIFSYGEASHPWFKKKITIAARVKESLDVDKFIGGSGVIFLGLDEGKFQEQWQTKKMRLKLRKLINKHRPSRIFTHSIDDPLPDHRAVNKCVMDTVDKMSYGGEVYMFDVWTMFNFKKMHHVSLVIDVTQTFKKKLEALRMFKSQIGARILLTWSVYIKAFINGKKNGTKYAEVFYRLK